MQQLLENIIADLSKDHGRDFHVVRLNGFIHTDDKLALREIWRQLGKEMQVEDDIANRVSYRHVEFIGVNKLANSIASSRLTMPTPWPRYWHFSRILQKSWERMRD
jgi:hypothetical protein